jgi:hypothetical protein
VVDPDGEMVPKEAVVEHLRFARTVRVGIEGNAHYCRAARRPLRHLQRRTHNDREEAAL